MSGDVDAVVVGSGPNGLAAAVELARHGASVLALESMDTIGGGTRTSELTLPGFAHDVCSAAHPLGLLSPYLSTLPLAQHGLEWIHAVVSVAHPLDDQPARNHPALAGGDSPRCRRRYRRLPPAGLAVRRPRTTNLCSAATPPGGGVHGMCGYYAARSALRRMSSLPVALVR